MPFLPAREAQAQPYGVDLTLRPPGDTDHYLPLFQLSNSPVIPTQTKIATHPHILCLLAGTYALTTLPVIVL